ncbi:MAG: AMP-binding protein [Bacteroidales bacterium]|nr:AMP-binding protein [Bacteroidales bacterium]MCL2738621.1 AMP-binding protein [Bacteroidales bacterium]
MHQNYPTLKHTFIHSIRAFADRPLFAFCDEEPLNYSQIGTLTQQLASVFDQAGLAQGSKIAILGANMPHWPVAYLASVTSSRVAVPILPDFTAFEIANILEHSESKALVVSQKLKYKIPDHLLQEIPLVVCMDTLEVLSMHPAAACTTSEPQPEDLASIIYTSGTSGTSKGVMLSHRNLCVQLDMIYKLFAIVPSDVFLSILPLSHAYECTIGMLYPFCYGASVRYLDGAPTPSLLMPALQSARPSVMLSVPLIVEKIYKNKIRPTFTKNFFLQFIYSFQPIRRLLHKIAGKKLLKTFGGNLRFFGIGGSKLDGVVERFLKDAGFPYAIGYGLSETAPLIAGAVPGKVKFQSTGPALDMLEVRIANPNKYGVGELQMKGDNVMMGYYKAPELTASVFCPDGWFRTKDLAKMDKEGNISIMGRWDNMIVGPSGENIYPEEIEAVINEHDLVLESLVAQIKGKMVAIVHFNYPQIEAWHQFKEEAVKNMNERVEKLKVELKAYINERVNKFSRIAEIIEQPLPFEKTATQKIKRFLYV